MALGISNCFQYHGMTAIHEALPCFQVELSVSQSYLTASVETGSQVSAALPTATQQMLSKQKFRN
jgi:hypothetical protein